MFNASDLIWIDFETFSAVDLKTAGPFRYATDTATRAIVLAYAIGNGPVRTWHADGAILDWDNAPDDLRAAFDRGMTFAAWNAVFDSAIWNYSTLGFPFLEPERVIDVAVQARVSNLPGDLEGASRYLGGEGKQKDGKKLIRLFCIAGANPADHPEEWLRFDAYAKQDVTAMRDVYRKTRPLPRREWTEYWAFEHVNRRGVLVDVPFVRRAAALAAEDARHIGDRLSELTDGMAIRVSQAQRIAAWLHDQLPDAEMRAVLTLGVAVPVPAPASATPIIDVSFDSADPRGRFVAIGIEREAIRRRREANERGPWSTEPILASYPKRKFCNFRREDDTGSRWVVDNIIKPYRDHPDLWFGVAAFRWCGNESSTWGELLPFLLPTFDAEGFRGKAHDLKNNGRPVHRMKAYKPVVPPRGDMINYHVDHVLKPLWRDREAWRRRPDETLNAYSNRLEQFPRIGGFRSAQALADLKPVAFKDAADYATYVRSGPGSKRGLNRILGRPVDASWTEPAFRRALMQVLAEVNPHFIAAGMAPLDAQAIQHWLCEYDKWERIRTAPVEEAAVRTRLPRRRAKAADRIAALEAALRRIDAINDNPACFHKDIDDVCRAALAPEPGK